jgi:hypothetical protein
VFPDQAPIDEALSDGDDQLVSYPISLSFSHFAKMPSFDDSNNIYF